MLTFQWTKQEDLDHVAANMRCADVIEVLAAGAASPRDALMLGFTTSDQCVTAFSPAGVPVAIFGISPVCRLTGVGSPWLLGTDELLQHKRHFLTDAPAVVRTMLNLYPTLQNYVHIENRLSVRWLQKIGFTLDNPVTFPSGHKFHRFWMKKES